jgi:hypothetical protein
MIYGDLFTRPKTLSDLQSQFKRLAMKMHPDKGGTNEQFFELKKLHDDAVIAFNEKSPWLSSDSIEVNDKKISYRWSNERESGTVFSGNDSLVFVTPKSLEDLSKNAKKMIDVCHEKLKYVHNINIKKTMYLIPKFSEYENVLVSEKPNDFHPLSLVVQKHKISPEHVAWMIGRLMHFMCFLEWAQIMHGGISIENLWVDLDHHQLALYGGWCYTRKNGERLIALPQKSAKFLKKEPIANYNIDRDCVRETIFELFGAKSASALRMRKDVPKPVTDFLAFPFRKSAIDTYVEWEKMRDSGFGPRKFVVFDYDEGVLYR